MRRLLPLTAALALVAAAGLPTAAPAALVGTPQTVATGLATPWEVVPMPDGRVLVTERPGRIRVIAADGQLQAAPVFTDPTPGITVRKFLGLARHPDWSTNRFVYLYETYTESGVDKSRVLRLVDTGSSLTFDRAILDGIGSDLNHDGGRVAFGPDGKLYVTTGDVHDPDRPRNPASFNGKILRLEAPGTDADGAPAADNPFPAGSGAAPYVWSMGHRHPQGLAWDAEGRLWETEHGPSNEAHAPAGATCCRDEVNVIVKGGDYGWPDAVGEKTLAGTIPPVVHSGLETWAPGDIAFASDGTLYAPALRGMHLRFFEPAGATIARHDALLEGTFGRMRTAAEAPGVLWLTTDGSSARVLRATIGAGRNPGPDRPVSPGGTVATETPTPTPTPTLDVTPPVLSVLLGRRQRPLRSRRLTLVARCDEPCTLRLTGRLWRGRSLRPRTRTAAPGERVRLSLALRRTDRRKLSRRLGRRPVTAVLRLRATDAGRLSRTRTFRIRVVR